MKNQIEGSDLEESNESPKEEKIEPYHVEEGFRHLMEAEKVKQNPKLLAKVKQHASKHGDALQAIHNIPAPDAAPQAKSTQELRAIRAKMSMKKGV
jgi:hypothetical protein